MSNDEEIGISQREAAKRIGKSQPWVHRMVQSGELRLLPNGRIDPRALTEIDTGGRTRAAPPLKAAGQTLVEAKLEREQWLAKQAALDYQERVGTLVSAAAVEARQTELATRLRDELLALPAQLAPAIVSLTDPRIIEARLRDGIVAVLRAFCASLEHVEPMGGNG